MKVVHYRDLKINLDTHPVKKDISLAEETVSITAAIKNLIFTDPYERFWAPTKGAGVRRTLFDNFGPNAEYIIQSRIKDTLAAYEPRAFIEQVTVYPSQDHNGYQCNIVYRPINSTEMVTVDLLLKRIR